MRKGNAEQTDAVVIIYFIFSQSWVVQSSVKKKYSGLVLGLSQCCRVGLCH